MKNQILILFSFFFVHTLQAQDVRLTLDRTRILIGEQMNMDIEADFKTGPVSWITLDSLPHFEILDRSKIDTIRKGDLLQLHQRFLLTSWDSGRWQLAPIALGATKTKPVTIDVAFSKMDPNQDYHDVKDILGMKQPEVSTWYWYLIFIGVLIILFLLFFPKEKKKEEAGFVPDEGAYKAALRKLEQLKTADIKDNKQLYTELIQIFREYLEKRKNIRSFSKTTDDLSLQISELSLPRDQFSELVQMLRLSDLVKFAQFQPAREENRQSIQVAEENIMLIEKLN